MRRELGTKYLHRGSNRQPFVPLPCPVLRPRGIEAQSTPTGAGGGVFGGREN